MITSPYTWLEDYTPKKTWLDGFLKNKQPVRTLDSLKKMLSPDFRLVKSKDLPFLIREHRRKYQWVVAEATSWLRR